MAGQVRLFLGRCNAEEESEQLLGNVVWKERGTMQLSIINVIFQDESRLI